MKKRRLENKVKAGTLCINEVKYLIEKWKNKEAWATELLFVMLKDIENGRGFVSGYTGNVIVVSMIIFGYKPAYKIILERIKEFVRAQPGVEASYFYRPQPTLDYFNVFSKFACILPKFKNGRYSAKREMVRLFKQEPLLQYEERYWIDYFDFSLGVFRKDESEKIIKINKIICNLNQEFKKYKENDFKLAYEEVKKILYSKI
jgi:hypothetical protein